VQRGDEVGDTVEGDQAGLGVGRALGGGARGVPGRVVCLH
jgi:hypothetical protein